MRATSATSLDVGVGAAKAMVAIRPADIAENFILLEIKGLFERM